MFLFLRLLHLLGVIVFVGNIVTAALWKARADASGDLHAIAYAQRGVMFADYVFTAPGAALILVTGLWLVLPVAGRLPRVADEAVRAGQLDSVFKALTTRWTIFGIVATLLPLVNVYLMV